MLQKIKSEWCTESVHTFIEEWNAEQWFEKTYGVTIDNWNFSEDDENVIKKYLHDKPELFIVVYDNCTDMFNIYEIDVS